ncbi:YtxH domain-containing protein [Flavobacterium salilacus subsp. salilacus]|uniref:YtxH domain-containing protein n=1 Tax=Flavobacterium TaxID=237 RepID=UPI0010754414|nr:MULTISPECIES: YtxH domain-containing protein [Flavobacterium]KAF2519014.1 YtxH domain-containing protein [Flavobacterium salilacus subsp. salilacus]MBE1614823.1 YtxH domain-containing protein [Flavobacterium sp. SaA2.13]
MAGRTDTLVAVIAGVAIGAVAGILFAPDEGSKTRRKIKEGYDSKKDELKDKLHDLTEQIKNKFGSSKEDIESGIDRLVSNVEETADDVIAALERKLEELKRAAAK